MEDRTMNTPKVLALMAVSALALSGCKTLSEGECLNADWYDIGVRDGANGRGEEYVARHAEACSELAIVPDRERWLAGRDQGLERYCTVHNGYRIGEVGGTYNGVCMAFSESDFLRGYYLGRDVNRVKSRLDYVENEIRSNHEALKSDKIEQRERERLMYRIAELEYERGYLSREYDTLAWRGRSL
jgi:hypothetical protein